MVVQSFTTESIVNGKGDLSSDPISQNVIAKWKRLLFTLLSLLPAAVLPHIPKNHIFIIRDIIWSPKATFAENFKD